MKQPPLGAEAFADLVGASATQTARLQAHLALLQRWQRRINLVGAATLADPWRRHVLDSAQLARLLPPGAPAVLDLGSGAGFPGLVLACLSDARVGLVESDVRKAAFLQEALRVTGISATVHRRRIEALPPASADVVVARALAPLPTLLGHASRLLRPGGVGLFLKGAAAAAELTAAAESWTMRATTVASLSDPAGVVVQVEELSAR